MLVVLPILFFYLEYFSKKKESQEQNQQQQHGKKWPLRQVPLQRDGTGVEHDEDIFIKRSESARCVNWRCRHSNCPAKLKSTPLIDGKFYFLIETINEHNYE